MPKYNKPIMQPFEITINAGPETIIVSVEPDARLRKSARWTLRGSKMHLRVPQAMTRAQVDQLIADIAPRVARQRKRANHQSDDSLMQRADNLNQRYFNAELSWHTIRWVKNMVHRLGSCTTGGTTDGDIRISDRLRPWPDYVLDYVIAHEICHRKYPNHSPEFWDYLARYPETQRALGFLDGISYADGSDPNNLMD